ncbi:BTB/POZ domain-containing protein 19 isoform X4 [Lissotriton helveticus]
MALVPAPPPGSALLRGGAASFTADIRSLLHNPLFSDVTFIVGKERRELYGHRCVLACRCRVFHEMFLEQPLLADSSQQGQPIVLSDVQPEVFLAVMEFLYTNCVTLHSCIALEVLTSALEYGLEDLRKSGCYGPFKDSLALQFPGPPDFVGLSGPASRLKEVDAEDASACEPRRITSWESDVQRQEKQADQDTEGPEEDVEVPLLSDDGDGSPTDGVAEARKPGGQRFCVPPSHAKEDAWLLQVRGRLRALFHWKRGGTG